MNLMRTLNFVEGVEFQSGHGARLIDSKGLEWIDFFADVGTASLGYAGPEQQEVLRRMIYNEIPVHAPNMYPFRERNAAARAICEAMDMDAVFFCNSGTEAVEAAIKIARLHHHQLGHGYRQDVWSIEGGFHGRTYGSLAAGDGPPHHYEGFGALPPNFHHFKGLHDIRSPELAAAIIMAPVFGNNDVMEYGADFLHSIQVFAKEHGIVLIFDEVQTGSGRTGAKSYSQLKGLSPDLITLAKGVAMGAPVGACLARGTLANVLRPGTHFSTFGGNPLSCAFVNGMMDWLAHSGNLLRVNQIGAAMRSRLAEAGLKNVRGPGMLIAFDYEGDTLELAKRCRARNLLIGAFRSGPGAVKITPPLNITLSEVEAGMIRLLGCL
jgi:acetylornithine/N-succinyldiaminopimelate aminotransferase